MLYPLYNWYNIKDDNIGCGKVITVECDWVHVYSDICTLMQNCLWTLSWQLTSNCVVDFLNTLGSYTPWHYLRISWSNCLEAVPLSFTNTDRLVAVDWTDTPWYLETKIVWCWDISVNKIWSWTNKQIEICYDGPESFTDLNDVTAWIYTVCADNWSNSYIWKTLRVNTTTQRIFGECDYKPIWAMYLSWNVVADVSPNQIQHYNLWWTSIYRCDNWMSSTTTNTLPNIWWAVYTLVAPIAWLYRISMKWTCRVNWWIQAIRLYVASTQAGLTWCVDSKFWSSDSPKQPLVFRYNKPITEDTFAYFDLWWDNIVYANAWTKFYLRFVIDSNAGTDINPIVTFFAWWLSWWSYNDPDWTYWKIAWVWMHLEFLRTKNFDNN